MTGVAALAGALAATMLWAPVTGHLGMSAALLLAAVWAKVSSRRFVDGVENGVEMNELHRHLSWSRRRGEEAAVLVCIVPRRRGRNAADIASSFRITDSVAVHRRGSTYEVHAVLDERDLDRAALERRILGSIEDVRIGWATFPHDGFALPALVDEARGRAGVAPVKEPSLHRAMTSRPASPSRVRVLMKRRPEPLGAGRGR